MTHFDRIPRKPTASAAFGIVLVVALLAGCGGSSKSSSTSTSASAAGTGTSTSSKGKQGNFAARAAKLRTCLQKNGIKLPERKPGQRGGFGAGAGGLPSGVSRAQLQAAFKKCGLARRPGQGFNAAASRQRFTAFAACMKSNGINLPAPNTSGKGPIFNTKGVDTSTAKFKAAQVKCAREELAGGGVGGPGPGRAPGGTAPGGAAPGGAAPGVR